MELYLKNSANSGRKKQRGAAIIEFALVAMLFFTLLFSIIDFGYLFFGYLSMQHAVREGSRFSSVTATGANRCTEIRNNIESQSMGFFTKSSAIISYEIVSRTTGLPTPAPVNNCGMPATTTQLIPDIVMIEVAGNLPLLTPFLKPFFSGNLFAYTVRSTMKIE